MNLKKVFFINTIIFFLIILLLELTARLLNLSDLVGVDSKLVITSEKNFHYLKPNSQGLVFNKKTFIDKYGFRVPRLDYNYKNKRKIFVIGDSVSFGNGVKEEDSFVGLLRSNLNRYELYNSSVFGYQAYHHENRIDEINKFLPVHKIFYFLTLNDVFPSPNIKVLNNNYKAENKYKIIEMMKEFINPDYINQVNYTLRNKSYFYMFLKGLLFDPQKVWFQNIYNYYSLNDLTNFNKYIKVLNNKAAEVNADLYIIILPYEFQTRECHDDILMPQNTVKKIIKNNEVKFFDFTAEFCKNAKPKELFYKYDPMHLSAKGHRLVYDIIKNKINF